MNVKITTQKQVETVPAKGTPYALGQNLYLDVRSDLAPHLAGSPA
ncbi:MAG TPA: hypothetical protein VFP43_14100 [Mesorhizobium sp.]|nr:hypothetical protein [Mesorhizobium sp.]